MTLGLGLRLGRGGGTPPSGAPDPREAEMIEQRRRIRSIRGLAVAFALLLAGCDQATGGGWIQSATGADKANFGFSVRCRTIEQNGNTAVLLYDGQLEWQDGIVRFHGDVEPDEFLVIGRVRCEELDQVNLGIVLFSGTYRPQGGGTPGTFTALVIDTGERGKIKGDFISIQLAGGQYPTYFNAGEVQGGNIQVR